MMAKAELIVFSLFILHSCAILIDEKCIDDDLENTDDTGYGFESIKPSWLAAIFRTVKGEKQYLCAGTLLNASTVITTATCAQYLKPYRTIVRAGEWDIRNATENVNYVDIRVGKIIMHEKYRKHEQHNDVAILRLRKDLPIPVEFIKLTVRSTEFYPTSCYVIGWGKHELKGNEVLKIINFPIDDHDTCQNKLRKTRLGPNFHFHESFICGGGEPKLDTCTSDGGMPFVCKGTHSNDPEYQVGLVSWGLGCGQENVPGVYTNVLNLQNWITSKIK